MVQNPDKSAHQLTCRAFVLAGSAVATAVAYSLRRGTEPVEAKGGSPKEVKIVQFSDVGQREDVAILPATLKTDTKWKQQLSPEAFEIARHAGTERAFSVPTRNSSPAPVGLAFGSR